MIEDKIYDTIPDGWKYIDGATNHPKGLYWINNGKSLFSKDYKQALCKTPKPKN